MFTAGKVIAIGSRTTAIYHSTVCRRTDPYAVAGDVCAKAQNCPHCHRITMTECRIDLSLGCGWIGRKEPHLETAERLKGWLPTLDVNAIATRSICSATHDIRRPVETPVDRAYKPALWIE